MCLLVRRASRPMVGGPVVGGFNKTLLVYILLIPVNKGPEFRSTTTGLLNTDKVAFSVKNSLLWYCYFKLTSIYYILLGLCFWCIVYLHFIVNKNLVKENLPWKHSPKYIFYYRHSWQMWEKLLPLTIKTFMTAYATLISNFDEISF